ncbi:MAG: efflux RND transporter periplasmic adaptor subunit [Planctomycetota bacterium]|nr:efflux RND transporter periplasmic adaptor subunit [Planctomycetota bacterium]
MSFRTNGRFDVRLAEFGMLAILGLTATNGDGTALSAAGPAAETAAGDRTPSPGSTGFAEFTGRTDAVETIEVRPGVSGYLVKTLFAAGQQVEQGQMLFEVDFRLYRAALEKAQAELIRARAETTVAQAEFARTKQLLATRGSSQADVEKATAQLGAAEATIKVAEAEVDVASLNLEATRITSPITGRIGQAAVSVGNWLQTGTLLATIVSQDPIHVYFDVDEKHHRQFAREARRDEASGRGKSPVIPVQIGLADEQGFPRQGTLNFLDIRFDAAKGTIRYRAVLSNADRSLLPGLFVRVRMPFRRPTGAEGVESSPDESPRTPRSGK